MLCNCSTWVTMPRGREAFKESTVEICNKITKLGFGGVRILRHKSIKNTFVVGPAGKLIEEHGPTQRLRGGVESAPAAIEKRGKLLAAVLALHRNDTNRNCTSGARC